jgi:hypothetical protein
MYPATQKQHLFCILKAFMLSIGLSLLFTACKTASHSTEKKIRGFMIDAPRATESIDYYFRLIDFCRKEQLNTIIFRLTDDQGSAYRFASHPELIMREGAFSKEELKKLVEYASARDIELIPEIESFGHSSYITKTQRFKFLNDSAAGNEYNALCPVSDSTLALMKDLYTEVASIFPSPWLHIGCDEVNWGGSELSKKALKTKDKNHIWAEYVNTLNGIVKALGKKTIIWGDVPIYKQKETLAMLDRDMVIMDWNYSEDNQGKVDSIARAVMKKGFKIIGAPGVSWCKWGPRVGESQFANVKAYAGVYCNSDDPNNLGIVLTNWVPKRYLQNSQWDTYAIAAEIVKNNGTDNRKEALKVFLKDHYGVAYNEDWYKIFNVVYSITPTFLCGDDESQFFPWSSEEQIKEILAKNERQTQSFTEVLNLLSACRDSVRKNMEDFDDFVLTIRFMDYTFNRQNSLLYLAGSGLANATLGSDYLNKAALEDQHQLELINQAWRRGRRCSPDSLDDNYMGSFYKAANYSRYLQAHPSELMKILKKKS